MVLLSKRGGVPVLNRGVLKPRSLIRRARAIDEPSPIRPAGVEKSPIRISPSRKVPGVITTDLA